MMLTNTCDRCKFKGLRRPDGWSHCYRYPPGILAVFDSERWPQVRDKDACGEFQSKDKP